MNTTRTDLLRSLEGAREELVDVARSLTAEELEVQVHEGGWNVWDVLAHVAASEARLLDRAGKIVNGQATPDPNYNPTLSTQSQVDERRGRTVEQLLAELMASRADMVWTLDALKDAQLDIEGCLASGKPIDVRGIIQRVADHERGHTEEIRAAIRR